MNYAFTFQDKTGAKIELPVGSFKRRFWTDVMHDRYGDRLYTACHIFRPRGIKPAIRIDIELGASL